MSPRLASVVPARPMRPAKPGREAGSVAATPPAAGLQLRLLGPPQVTWDGRPLEIPRMQARALLFRLAVAPNGVPRTHLHFLFWPDAPEASASRRFTRLLTHLRRALPVPELVPAGHDGIVLDLDRVWCDALAFADLIRVSDPASHVECLCSAVALYQGAFLAGFNLHGCSEFEAWCLQERCILERHYLEALDMLMETRAASGAFREAVGYALRYLQVDELAERLHRRLMELYVLAGDRSAALQQYERCAVALERELGVDPVPETRAVYESLLRSKRPAGQPIPAARWTTLPSLHAPLVGRDDALGRLEQAWACTRSGRGQVVLIAGEPGVGKSRLLQEFATTWQDRARVFLGSGHEARQDLPYRPLLEALQPCAPEVIQLMPAIERPLSRLWPELSIFRAAPGARLTAEVRQERGFLFDALCDVLLRLARQQQPLVLCLDDLHWADATTLRWLGYLSERIADVPVLVVGTYRSEEAGDLAALRAQLARRGSLQEILLAGLSQADVLCLIRHLSGQSDGAELFSQRLHRETGGNPYFVLETLRAMFEAGILWQDETGWSTHVDETTEDYRELPLPDTLHQAIRERLRRLSPQARQVLEAGAALGPQFDLDLVLATSGRSEDEVVEALEMLLARQIFSSHDDQYRFHHELVRATVLLDLSYGRRRLLERRAAQAWTTLHPGTAAHSSSPSAVTQSPARPDAPHSALTV